MMIYSITIAVLVTLVICSWFGIAVLMGKIHSIQTALCEISQQLETTSEVTHNRAKFNGIGIQYALVCLRAYIYILRKEAVEKDEFETASQYTDVIKEIDKFIACIHKNYK